MNLGRFCLTPTCATLDLPHARPVSRYYQHEYSRTRIQTQATKRSYVTYWMDQRWPEFLANYRSELAALQKIISVCKNRHLRVALLDLPRDLSAIGSTFDAPVSTFHGGCSTLARRWDIPWLHFVGSCDFVDTDFFNIFHLVEPGRVKFQGILSDETIRLLKKYGMGTPSTSASPSPAAAAMSATSRSGSAPSSAASTVPRYLLLGFACLLALAGIGVRIWNG